MKRAHTGLLTVIIFACCSLFLYIDLSLPLGVAAGVKYVAVVLLGLWLPKWWHTIGLATLVSILVIIGFYFSESGSTGWIVMTNRVLAVAVIWCAAILILLNKRSEEQLVRLNSKLVKHSFQDGLTEIPNRRIFDQTITRDWGDGQGNALPVSLLMIDIDFFKQYNDHYGHQQGDECLKQVAQALHGITRRASDLTARYGGEEFVMLLPNTNNKQAIQLAEQCCSTVAQLQIPHTLSSVSDVITISVGVATTTPTDTAEPSTLLAAADKHLYQAKNNGRNRVAH